MAQFPLTLPTTQFKCLLPQKVRFLFQFYYSSVENSAYSANKTSIGHTNILKTGTIIDCDVKEFVFSYKSETHPL